MLVAMLANAKSPAGYRAAFGSGLIGGQGAGGGSAVAGVPGSPGLPGTMAGTTAGGSGGAAVPAMSGGAGGAASGVAGGVSAPFPSAGGVAIGSSAGSGSPGASGSQGGTGNGGSVSGSTDTALRPGGGAKSPNLSPDGNMAKAVFGESKPVRRESRVTYRAAPGGGVIQEIEPDDSSKPSGSLRRGDISSGSRYGSAAASPGGTSRAARSGSQGPSAVERSTSAGSDAKAAAQSVAVRPGEWIPQEEKPQKKPDAKERHDEKSEHHDGKSKRLADTRGENWGLPNAARGSVGITRPIRVRCASNRLEILPDNAEDNSKAIPLGERIEDTIDDFVSAVWEHMKSWGIAGRGMYWRPILHIEVTPDAEFRYAELKVLLDDSGLIVERKM
jgi:hypothetical protein